jgi:hypothetical protein
VAGGQARADARHRRIILKPSSADLNFEPIVFRGYRRVELEIIAELVEVLE